MGRTTIHYGSHHSQVGDLWLPGAAADHLPVVVLIHGGFWRAQFTKALMGRLARAVTAQGWAAWNIEYRRVGVLGGGGGWPATFLDIAAAVDHLASLPGIDTDRVATCGHSAGGTFALWVAGRHRLPAEAPGSSVKVPVTTAISLAGVVDLAAADVSSVGGDAVARFLGGDAKLVPDRFRMASPAALLPLGVPQFLIHGLQDSVVPPAMSEAYAAEACQAGDDAHYIALPGVGHREVIDPAGAAWDNAREQLERTFAR
jgi:acetyl esterase/lipase